MSANIFNVNTIFFTVLNYDMSYIELFGTVFTAISVYLAAKNKVITWPIGIIGVILYGFLFYQIQLYSDLIEQFYYLITGFWGWWLWTHPKNKDEKDKSNELKISNNSHRENVISVILIAIASLVMGYYVARFHLIFPSAFSEPASFPYLDAFTTVMSFLANFLLMKRRIESWYLWIIVDVIGVWLYFVKGVPLLSILYFAFLINAFWGYSKWKKTLRSYEEI